MSENDFNIMGMLEAARRMEERGEAPRYAGIAANDELAQKYLGVALKYGKFDEFLFSMPMLDLKIPDGYGGMVHSARHVMNAIYTKHREDDTLDFAQMVTETITATLTRYQVHPCIVNLIENLEWHMQAEKDGTAAFTLDMDVIFDVIRGHLLKNQEIYKQPSQRYGPWPQIEMWDARLKGSFGKGIL